MRFASLVAVLAITIPSGAQAESAGKVIDLYLEASGGKKAVEKIVSSEVSARVTTGDGSTGTLTLRTRRPRLWSVSVSVPDAGWRTGFNGRSAWNDERPDGPRTLYGEAAARVRAEAMFANTRYLSSDHIIEFSVRGPAQVRGRAAMALVASAPDGQTRTLFFDEESHLLVKDEQGTGAGMEERFFDDYRRVDDVMEPHRIEWRRNGQMFVVLVDRVTHNISPDVQLFDMPVRQPEPPIDIAAVLASTRQSEERAASVRMSYAYRHTSTIALGDQQSRVTPKESWTYDVFHLGGRPVPRLTSRGGRPLSEAEQRRVDAQVRERVLDYERQRLAGQPFNPGQTQPLTFASLFQAPLLFVADWLPAYVRLLDFSNIRREPGDRPVLVVEFQPKRGATPKNEGEAQITRMSGTFWIDELSMQVRRIESYFSDAYDQNVPGSSVRMERALVNDEVWLPVRGETYTRRTRGLGNSSQSVNITEFSDYKKFDVSTDSDITLPDPGR